MIAVFEELKIAIKVSFFSNSAIVTSSRNEYEFISPGSSLDEIVNSVDIAICTASGSAVEFIAREIPLGVVCAATNQERLYMEMSDLGLASPLGSYSTEAGWDINRTYVEDLIFQLGTRAGLQIRQREFIDLKGPTRILDVIDSLRD
jgi:spore coat polysaccharide biosynthesis predicted glycosyltransferase SpsG